MLGALLGPFADSLSPLTFFPVPPASQVRPGPRTSTAWSTRTTSAWSWKKSSTIAVISPFGGNQSWLPIWGSLNGRCVGPSTSATGVVLGVWPSGYRQIMELSQGRGTERLSLLAMVTQHSRNGAPAKSYPTPTKPNIPEPQ